MIYLLLLLWTMPVSSTHWPDGETVVYRCNL